MFGMPIRGNAHANQHGEHDQKSHGGGGGGSKKDDDDIEKMIKAERESSGGYWRKPKFKEDQTVRIQGRVHGAGKKGRISTIAPSGSFFGVEDMSGRHLGYYHESDLKGVGNASFPRADQHGDHDQKSHGGGENLGGAHEGRRGTGGPTFDPSTMPKAGAQIFLRGGKRGTVVTKDQVPMYRLKEFGGGLRPHEFYFKSRDGAFLIGDARDLA